MSDQQTLSEVKLPPRYQLQATLSENASNSVFRVFDLVSRREEALKVMRHELSQHEDLLQFKTEFKTLAKLSHPNIIKVYDFGLLEEKYPYFTMEYFAGRRVTEFFNGQNWEALYDVILQIAAGLHHIHHFGIIHLDLKPTNVLVDANGAVKIMDFGVAAESRQFLDRKIRGTLHYMAPEVLRQDRVDARADLYGLGMTLYETVTGALPTYGKPPIDIIRFHLDEELRRPSSINPNIPDRLEKIILKLLEKDPRHRYSSAAALFDDVAEAAGVKSAAGGLLVGTGELLVAPLIGRDREIDQLMDAVARARDGHGGGVLVYGGEGMGKSRMVREATLRAQLDGARVFCGRCPINRKSIYAPFFDIFQQMLVAMNPDADAVAEIRRILRPAPSTMVDERPRGQKFRLYNRVAQSIQDFYGFLNVVGNSGSPLVLVVEDLQWADPSTAELLTFLVGEAKHSKLLVVGTLTIDREPEALLEDGRDLLGAWQQRARESEMTMIELGALTEEQTRDYVGALLGDTSLQYDFVRWIMWESGGSPVQIRRVIDYLIAHDYLQWVNGRWSADMPRIQMLRIPGGSAAVWSEKIESLSDPAREVLQIASVLGEQFDLPTITEMAGAEEETMFERVRALASQGLLDTLTTGRSYAFPQLSLREAIYGAIPTRNRAELHRRAAAILERQLDAGAAELIGQVAYHYARGDAHQQGIEYSIRAGKQASEALAHEQAAEFYRIALELMDLSGEDHRKLEIRERLADSYYRANNLRGAMQVYQFLLKSVQTRPEEPRRAAAIMKKIGKVLAKRGEFDAALTYFQNATSLYQQDGALGDVAEMLNRAAWLHKEKGDYIEALKAAESALDLLAGSALTPTHGYVQQTIGTIAFARGDWQTARRAFEDALATAEAVSSDQLRKVSTASLGNVMWKLGEWDDALAFFRRNLEQSEHDGDLWDLVLAYNNVALIEFSRGNFHAAANLFDRSIRIDEKLGSPDNEAVAQENLGEALEMIGRWGEARDRYERCLHLDGFDENRTTRISVYVPLARLTSKTGDIPRAMQYAQKAYDAARRARDEDLTAEAALVLAQIEKERENVAEAAHYMSEAIALFEHSSTAHGLSRALILGAEIAMQAQKLDDAKAMLERGASIARSLGDRFTSAVAEWLEGKLLFFAGERQAAEMKFSEVEAVFDELDTPYEMGRLFFDLGLLREDPEEAALALRRAIKTFERLEATHDLDRARGALFRLRPTGKKEAGVVGLYEIVKIINSTLSVEEVLNRVLDLALRRLRAERGMIILIDPITSALRTRVARNIKDGADGDSRRSPQSIIKEVIQSGHSIISADARADERFVDSDSVIAENIVSTLCVPLVIRERISGAIYVDHRETRHLFSQRDLNFLEAFADQAAIAIQNARLYEEIEEARARLSLENETLRREVLMEKHLDSVVGTSDAVGRIQFTIKKAASSHSTVLLRGESGTGKGLVARIIHNVSARRNGPFIKFNCAALPETLAESELFGHEKGAFTGADRRKLGRFELASGGTIFLDEIGKMTLAMQSKLLRVVEDKEFERVGGTQTIKVDVKIIAATNLEIERAIEEGTFREDLFYRLNIIPLMLPPLRERKQDIPALAEHFIRKICKDLGVDMKRLEPGILDLFAMYDWPGNVRELEATIHRAIVMSDGDVLTRSNFYGLLSATNQPMPEPTMVSSEVPTEMLGPMIKRLHVSPEVYDEMTSHVDKQLILRALDESGGKIRETARRLGLARNTLKAKMQKYSITIRE